MKDLARFVLQSPQQARLEVFWWGNALTVFGGYSSLWVIGFALAGLAPQAWLCWLVLTLRLVRAGARQWEWLVDLSFWLSRLGVLLLLWIGSWLSH
jgi:hypothetical protein